MTRTHGAVVLRVRSFSLSGRAAALAAALPSGYGFGSSGWSSSRPGKCSEGRIGLDLQQVFRR